MTAGVWSWDLCNLLVTAADGSDSVRLSRTGSIADAVEVGRALAADLLDAGADQMMESSL